MALTQPTVVILRALGLGDLLTAVPALRALAEAFPAHRRVLATTAAMTPWCDLIEAVDESVAVEPLGPLPRHLAEADVAVNLHGRGPQSHRVLLEARPRRLVAFANHEAGVAGPAWRAAEHEVARWCRLLDASGIPADPTRIRLAPDALRNRPVGGAPAVPGATVIHPGAASEARRWPVERWADVAAGEVAGGRTVLVTGAAGELDLCRRLVAAAGLPPAACLAGTTDAATLAAVVAVAGAVLSGDTGVAHLATALGRPSVVLFGPVPPAEWGPPPECPAHLALWAGRRGDPHGDRTDPGLLAITVDDVLGALGRLRAGRAPAAGG